MQFAGCVPYLVAFLLWVHETWWKRKFISSHLWGSGERPMHSGGDQTLYIWDFLLQAARTIALCRSGQRCLQGQMSGQVGSSHCRGVLWLCSWKSGKWDCMMSGMYVVCCDSRVEVHQIRLVSRETPSKPQLCSWNMYRMCCSYILKLFNLQHFSVCLQPW